jgi:hypothetical protein
MYRERWYDAGDITVIVFALFALIILVAVNIQLIRYIIGA